MNNQNQFSMGKLKENETLSEPEDNVSEDNVSSDKPDNSLPAETSCCQPVRNEPDDESRLESINLILRLQSLENSMSDLQHTIEGLVKQQEIMQTCVRQLSTRITEAAGSLSAPRIRELYERLLRLYDLVEPPPAHLQHQESISICRLIATQIEQFLEVNGFRQIETDGLTFDPRFHKPVKVVAGEEPGMDGRIVSTVRHGFKSDHTPLRPAEVVMVSLSQKALPPKEESQAANPIGCEGLPETGKANPDEKEE